MPNLKDESILPKNRIEALCDGIFAIAMTIMVLDLKTPENIPLNLASKELPKVLWTLYPQVEAYVLSFILLGIFWLRHQIQFKYIKAADRNLLGINVIFLMLIGFVPFSVGFMMRYIDFFLPFVIYILNLLLISIVLFFQWIYVARNHNRLLDEDMDQQKIKIFSTMSMIPIIIFTLSLLVSFVNVRVAFYIIYIDPLFYVIYRRLIKLKVKNTSSY